jgi:hypothetical protein
LTIASGETGVSDGEEPAGHLGAFQEEAEQHESVALIPGHRLSCDATDQLTPALDAPEHFVGPSVEIEVEVGAGQIEMEDIDRLPQLGRDPVPQAAGVVTGPLHRRDDRPRVGPIGHQITADGAARQRTGIESVDIEDFEQLAPGGFRPVARRFEEVVIGHVEHSGGVLGPLDVATDPTEILSVA